MHRRHARQLVATLLAAGLLLVSAGSVAAADPPGSYSLDAFSCGLFDADGNPLPSLEVPAGSEIAVYEGWITTKRGQLQSFANNVTWVLTLNGQPVDVTPYLSDLIGFGPFWGQFFAYPAGTLDAGESLHTHYDNVLKSASFDGVAHYAKGSVYGGGVDCTVTVAP
jgi:hypothetical protein